jgi:hypothetical protein
MVVGRYNGTGVYGNEVWLGVAAAGSVFGGVAEHEPIFCLFDPFDGSIEAVADRDLQARVVDIFDVSVGGSVERVLVFKDLPSQPVDLIVEGVVEGMMGLFMLLEGSDQRGCNGVHGDGVEVVVGIQDALCRSGRETGFGVDQCSGEKVACRVTWDWEWWRAL